MINYEQFHRIKHMLSRGLKPSQVAHELGLDQRTVHKWVSDQRYHQREMSNRASKLDKYKEYIRRMLELHSYSGAQIFHRIKEQGYTGGYTILKDYLQIIRPKNKKAYLTLAFSPGECAQVDWGSYGAISVGNTRRRLSFFVMVLCYSRMMYLEFTVSQTMEHFLSCHQNAFQFFKGIPRQIMVDNLKSAVLKRALGEAPILNPRYMDLAHHFGFEIVPCNVGKGNEKGRVENAVGYVKKNLLAGFEMQDFSVINPQARIWLDTIANIRMHGTTHEKPKVLLEKERPHLQALPVNPFDCANQFTARASSQFRITIDTNRYSVPFKYSGVLLTVKAYPERICIYHQNNLIARHPRCYDRHKDIEDPDHPKELLAQRKKARDQKLFIRFLALSERAEEYWHQLEQRRMNPVNHVRKIVALSEIYSPESVERAIRDAVEYQAFSSEYIANLLEQRNNLKAEPGALHLTRGEDLLKIEIEKPDLTVYDKEVQ